MRKFLIIFILILFAAVGIIGVWYYQRNSYSKEALKLEILSQDSAQAGELVEYLVRYKNNGNVVLEEPELIFEYPENSVTESGGPLRYTEKINDIYPGQEGNVSFKARIFGKENDLTLAQAWLSYKPRNLKARFESETTKTVQIKFVPLTLEFDLPSKLESGQNLQFSLNYFSNIDYLLENLRLNIIYPGGFEFVSASPKALEERDWDLSSIYKGDGGRIKIEGKVEGDVGSQKIFKASLGLVRDGEFLVLKEASAALQIAESLIYVSQTINGSVNFTAQAGDLLHYEVFFKNIGRAPVQKKFLLVRLSPEFFDLNTLKSDKGESGPGDNSVIFDWQEISSLRFLDAGEEGKVEFWVKVKDKQTLRGLKNPLLENEVKIGDIDKKFETKVNSELALSQKVYFQEDFFGNSGPLPPQVGQTTTYTVLWQVSNSWNDVKNVKVKTVLPKNVKPSGKTFPEGAGFTFDSASREVIWSVGDVPAWTDEESPVSLAFQIEFRPDSSQQSRIALLVGETEISGEDVFTGEILHEKTLANDTTLPDDEQVSGQQGIIE